MKKPVFLRFALPLALVLVLAACNNDDDVTSSNGSLARVAVDAPASARTGEQFDVEVTVQNLGVSNIRDGRVDISLPAPLTVVSVDTSAGTTATFINGLTGGRVTWDLGTLDSNTQSRLTIRTIGVLASGQGSTRVTVEASMTGQNIGAGDAVARDDVTINP